VSFVNLTFAPRKNQQASLLQPHASTLSTHSKKHTIMLLYIMQALFYVFLRILHIYKKKSVPAGKQARFFYKQMISVNKGFSTV
ncbi:MAG: hypothetical protein IK138_06550, partial [Lachnospiraceae bacterium]|nr:hypothetical protein [Lachnospiraceae bacterium]